jgi:polysaccharide biosynthesis/export protein
MSRILRSCHFALLACSLWPAVGSASGQEPANQFAAESNLRAIASDSGSEIVGPSDVLTISAFEEPSLTGTFAVEADSTFSYPQIGRIRAVGRTLLEIEAEVVNELVGRGLSCDPQIMVTVERYRPQNVFVVGEVGAPGAYAVPASMALADVLALAGSRLPSAGGEAVIVPAGHEGVVVLSSAAAGQEADEASGPSASVRRVWIDALADDAEAGRVTLSDGDTVFVLPAENIYVLGHVTHPGAYAMQRGTKTVSDAITLAGGATNLSATSRIEITRLVDGKPKKINADPNTAVLPGDTIAVPQRWF